MGLVGPKDSVEEAMKVADTISGLKLIPFIYSQTEETKTIIQENRHNIEQWLFSGPVPYKFALAEKLIEEHEADYIRMHGSSLLGAILEAIMTEGKVLKRLSLDTISKTEISQMLEQFDLKGLHIQTSEQKTYSPADKLIAFHESLFRSNEVDAVLTCIHSVFKGLQAKKIPVYRIHVSELAAHRALSIIKERGLTKSYRMKQLAMVGVEIIYASQGDQRNETFKIRKQELELNRVLLNFTEEINGSMMKMDNGTYFTYTTRGELELYTRSHSIIDLKNEIFVNSKLQVRIGLGFGQTVLESEENVRTAIDLARSENSSSIISIDENKQVSEITADDFSLIYDQRKSERDRRGIDRDAKISLSIIGKIESLSKHYQKEKITSLDLSRWMKSTERNARRILAEMERMGYANVVGEEFGQRGRPRKIYRLIFLKMNNSS